MSASWLQYVQLSKFSKPAIERRIYAMIKRNQPRNIVEIGVGTAQRATRIISVAQRFATGAICYTGIDMFEAASDTRSRATLKEAHQLLTPLSAEVRLVPGDSVSGLARCANNLANVDLLIVTADADSQNIEPCKRFLSRMLHDHSLILLAQPNGFQKIQFVDLTASARRAA